MTDKTPWAILSRIDVKDRIEKKNGLSYLSWAWAWGTLKEHFGSAWFRKHEAAGGIPYFIDMQGYAYVRVTVGLDKSGDHEVTETFPILDHRNKAIQGPNSFDVNNALQRCLAKCIAYHGLGHYIYAGEDVPMEAQEAPVETRVAPPAPTPVKMQSLPPAAVPAASGGVPVAALDGTISSHPVEAVAEVFKQFIPTCADEKTLTKFYTANKTAVAYLEATNPNLHKQVLEAFSARKAELKSKPEGAK